jgi:hypothetical protein
MQAPLHFCRSPATTLLPVLAYEFAACVPRGERSRQAGRTGEYLGLSYAYQRMKALVIVSNNTALHDRGEAVQRDNEQMQATVAHGRSIRGMYEPAVHATCLDYTPGVDQE